MKSGGRAYGGELTRKAAADVRTVAKGGVVQLVGQFVLRGSHFLFIAVVARVLGPAGYGLYRQVAQILELAGALAPMGLNVAVLREVTHARAEPLPGGVRGATRVGLAGTTLVSIVLFLALFFAAEPIASAFANSNGDPALMANLLRIGAAYIPLHGLMMILRSTTQAYKTMVPTVMIGSVIQPAALVVLSFASLLLGFRLAGVVTSLVLSAAMGFLAGIWFYLRMLTPEERQAAPAFDLGRMVRFSLPQAANQIIGIRHLGPGVLILGLTRSDAEVGMFAIAMAIQAVALLFNQSIMGISAPVVADLHKRGEIERLQDVYQMTLRWVGTFSFPLIAALIIEPDLFAELLGGSRGVGAAALVPILALGTLVNIGTGPCALVITMTGRPAVNLINSLVGVGLYVSLGFLFAPAYGAFAIAIIDTGVAILLNIVRVVEMKWLVGIRPFGRSLLKPIGATLAASALMLAWNLVPGEGFVIDIAGLALAAAVYLLVLRVMGIGPEERLVYDRIKARLLPGARRGEG